MEPNPVPTFVVPRGSPWRTVQVVCVLLLVLGNGLSWAVGSGDVGIVNLSPRPATIPTKTLCYLAVLGAIGLGWAILRTLPACFRLVVRGDFGFPGPVIALGSISSCLLCWSLWDFEGLLCTVVLLAGFLLTDGAILVSGLWHHTGGRMLRALGRARKPAWMEAVPEPGGDL